EARLTRAEEVGHFGSWEWDIVTNDLHWSDEQFRIHGLSPNDPTPDIATIKAFCHPDDLRQVQELFSKVLADPVRHQPSFDWEIRIVRADGQVRSLACHATIVTDQDGMPIRILGVAHDITERKGAEHERQTFIANAAHELRTPLTSLAGFAKLLNVSWDRMSEDAISSSLQAMARQGDRATSLINNLLDMAQLESGQITVAVEPVNVHSVVSRALVKHPVPSGVTMTLVGERDILVRADPIRLEQVISNLISNAYKFGGKLIEISVQKTETGARLVVADDGPGINDQVAATIFDPFVRGTSRQHIAGSGLGLAIARQLSEAMGGRLRYESNPPMGARFVVELGAALGTDRSRTSLKIDNL
ncbi:MAG: ATP-binding protein, partial [Actinomycetota bacterium]